MSDDKVVRVLFVYERPNGQRHSKEVWGIKAGKVYEDILSTYRNELGVEFEEVYNMNRWICEDNNMSGVQLDEEEERS